MLLLEIKNLNQNQVLYVIGVNTAQLTLTNLKKLLEKYIVHIIHFGQKPKLPLQKLQNGKAEVELKEKTERITGKPAKLPKGDRVVAEVIGREGNLQDNIFNVVE